MTGYQKLKKKLDMYITISLTYQIYVYKIINNDLKDEKEIKAKAAEAAAEVAEIRFKEI